MGQMNEESYVWSPNVGCLLGNPAVLKSSELRKVIPYRYVALLKQETYLYSPPTQYQKGSDLHLSGKGEDRKIKLLDHCGRVLFLPH